MPTVFEDLDGIQAVKGISVEYAIDNVNDTTPTQAECITAFGAIATKTNAWLGVINDSNGNVNIYLVMKAGTKYAFTKLTVAA